MDSRRSIILAMAIYLFLILSASININIVRSENNQELKTDLKIITNLEYGGFLTPAICKNNTFAYNYFEFNLYSNTNNTRYNIEVNNITITYSEIEDFKKIFLWKCKYDYIDILKVKIGNDTYLFSNIFVFSTSVTNKSILKDQEYIKFTERELDIYITQIRLRMLGLVLWGCIVATVITYMCVKTYKKDEIKRIA
jgi:hypothetical protein